MMKAAYIEETGPPERIVFGEVKRPNPSRGQVLVRVGAASLNPIDTYVRSGLVAMELPQPYVLGCDLAGTVEAVGANVTAFEPGQRVWGSNQGLLGRQGTFSEYVSVDTEWLYPTPDGVDDMEAAAMALVGITAHLGLVHRGRLQAGETVFVNGGSGGVGSAVVQISKCLGAGRVITTAGNSTKAAICKQLGADEVILYKKQNVLEEVQRLAPDGVNLWWETVRQPKLDDATVAMARDGRIIVMAGRDAIAELPVGPFYAKGCSLLGFVMFMVPAEVQATCAEDINRWMAEGSLKPLIDRVMPLSKTAEAHRLQEDSTVGRSGGLAGKIILQPDGEKLG